MTVKVPGKVPNIPTLINFWSIIKVLSVVFVGMLSDTTLTGILQPGLILRVML